MPRPNKVDQAIQGLVAERTGAVCRICGCSEFDGCAIDDGCMWARPNLCSTCFEMAHHMACYFEVAGARATRRDPEIFQRVLNLAGELFMVPAEPEAAVVLPTEDETRQIVAGVL